MILDCLIPDKAKLERAKPAVRIPTISQGGNPRSTEERNMQTAGDKKAIVWHILRTYIYKNEDKNWLRMK